MNQDSTAAQDVKVEDNDQILDPSIEHVVIEIPVDPDNYNKEIEEIIK